MIFILTARHFKAHDSLKQFANEEAEKLTKFFEGITRAEVILSYDKPSNSVKTAEVIINAKHNHILTAKESSTDFRLSLEQAFDKIQTQLKKYKDKLTDHHPKTKPVIDLENDELIDNEDIMTINGEQTGEYEHTTNTPNTNRAE